MMGQTAGTEGIEGTGLPDDIDYQIHFASAPDIVFALAAMHIVFASAVLSGPGYSEEKGAMAVALVVLAYFAVFAVSVGTAREPR